MTELETTPLTPTIRHNAMISYCFLAIFMLISRQEQFAHPFVRAHAKYALLIHGGFLVLIIGLIFSRNFSSVILFELSWVHIVLFILFASLLVTLAAGILSAFRGHAPKFSLNIFHKRTITLDPTEVSEDHTGVILSHIPLFGTYMVHKYGEKYIPGARFGNWLLWTLILTIWIDPSLVLFCILMICATAWLIYQTLSMKTYGKVTLIGQKLWSTNDIHKVLIASWKYVSRLAGTSKVMPHWDELYAEVKAEYKGEITALSEKTAIPLVNIPLLIKNRSTRSAIWYQNLLLSILIVVGIIFWSYLLIFATLCLGWWLFFQIRDKKNAEAPLLAEIGKIITLVEAWKKKKSIPEKITLS